MFTRTPALPPPVASNPSGLERAKERDVEQSERTERIVESYVRATHAARRR